VHIIIGVTQCHNHLGGIVGQHIFIARHTTRHIECHEYLLRQLRSNGNRNKGKKQRQNCPHNPNTYRFRCKLFAKVRKIGQNAKKCQFFFNTLPYPVLSTAYVFLSKYSICFSKTIVELAIKNGKLHFFNNFCSKNMTFLDSILYLCRRKALRIGENFGQNPENSGQNSENFGQNSGRRIIRRSVTENK
jgi:hypothetical protein